jgi:(p)ppGpp synthase/HD superfamily hydrolase
MIRALTPEDTGPSFVFTRGFVQALFAGVLDKGGKPYADHCVRVALDIQSQGAPNDVVTAAMLHDVIEDVPGCDAGRLLYNGFSIRTVSLVEALSRPAGSVYMDWIRQIAASGDEWLIRIKLADNKDNSDPARIEALPPKERGIVDRYRRAREILERGLSS